MNENTPIASVCVISYNHEKYIAQAIDSVLMQKTNFDFEIVIGEDFSTDRTRIILLDYKAKYPGKIKLLLQEKNVGMMQNFIDTLKACKGKYIALLEGDDYWIDPYKLQKQVNILESNSEYSMCFTARYELDENNNYMSENFFIKDNYITRDFLEGFIPPTQTVMFRNILGIIDCIDNHKDFPSGDRLLGYFCSLKGKIFNLKEITSVYRHSGKGVWSSTKLTDRTYIVYNSLKVFHSVIGLPFDNEIIINKAIQAFWYMIKKNFKKPNVIFTHFFLWYKQFLSEFGFLKISKTFISLGLNFIRKKIINCSRIFLSKCQKKHYQFV